MPDIDQQNNKMLLIDDDDLLLEMYAMKFREQGLEVVSVQSASEGLAQLRAGLNPSLLVFDMIMPTMDGLDFLETVKKEKLAEGATIVVLSNHSDPEHVNKATALGAHGYILKSNMVPSEVLKKVLEIAKGRK